MDLSQRLGLELAKRQAANLTPEEVANASPAMQQAAQGMNESGEAAQNGGVSPRNLAAQIDGRTLAESRSRDGAGAGGALKGQGGGMPPGAPQPAQAMGRAQQILGGSQLG